MAELVKTSFHKKKFLDAYSRTGMFYKSAKEAGITPQAVYRWINGEGENKVGKDEAFGQLFEDAKKQYLEIMETEADRRGREGVDKPVFQGGGLVGHVREYSDTMLIFRLKALDKVKYAERKEHTGEDGKDILLRVVYDNPPSSQGTG